MPKLHLCYVAPNPNRPGSYHCNARQAWLKVQCRREILLCGQEQVPADLMFGLSSLSNMEGIVRVLTIARKNPIAKVDEFAGLLSH